MIVTFISRFQTLVRTVKKVNTICYRRRIWKIMRGIVHIFPRSFVPNEGRGRGRGEEGEGGGGWNRYFNLSYRFNLPMKTARCVFFFVFCFFVFFGKQVWWKAILFFHVYNIPPRKINSGHFLLRCIFP